MRKNNYTSFFKIKPKKVERYIRCRKCGGNMEWGRILSAGNQMPEVRIY